MVMENQEMVMENYFVECVNPVTHLPVSCGHNTSATCSGSGRLTPHEAISLELRHFTDEICRDYYQTMMKDLLAKYRHEIYMVLTGKPHVCGASAMLLQRGICSNTISCFFTY